MGKEHRERNVKTGEPCAPHAAKRKYQNLGRGTSTEPRDTLTPELRSGHAKPPRKSGGNLPQSVRKKQTTLGR